MLMVVALSDNDNEKRIHRDSIEMLAKELRKEIWEVALIYTSVLDNLEKEAHVKTFLHILVSKKVREIMSH